MWSNSTKLDQYTYPGSGTPPEVIEDWLNSVNAHLPGANSFPPIIDVDGNTVTVTMRWQQARDSGKGIDAGARQYTTVAYISCC
jgi:hypothetical protein